MITKTEQHDTDRAGKRLLRAKLEKLGWVLNDVQEDYGIDSNVQVFDGNHPTGAWFHVQLKSSCHSAYSSDCAYISQELSIDHARHYATELRQPIGVVHADVAQGKVYWYFPQLDKNLVASLCGARTQSITVRIPTSQELPGSAPDVLLGLEKIYLTLANRELVSASAQSFLNSLPHLPDQQKLANAFQAKNDILKLKRIRDFYEQGKIADARSRADVLLKDPDSAIEAKFWVQLQLQAIDYHETLHAGKPQAELSKLVLRHAKALQQLTRSGPKYLKFYALITRHAAELESMSYESFTLYMAFQQHMEAGGSPALILGLYARRAILTRQMFQKYNRCVRLARYAANYPDRWMLARALANIVKGLGTFMSVLRRETRSEYEDSLERSALQICKLSSWISAETGDVEGIVLSISGALLLIRTEDSDAFRWAHETAQNLRDDNIRADALGVIERAAKRWRGEEVSGDYRGDTVWQVIQNIASAMGVDLTEETSPLVRELRIAARDNKPDRVLVQCEHLLTCKGAIGPMARYVRRVFALDTGGAKVIHCTLHDYHIEGRELDLAYTEFKKLYCDSCLDAKPRSRDWRYDDNARAAERARFTDFIDGFRGKPFGLRYTDHD